MKKIRLAVVGAGQFGRHHARVVEQSTRAELVAIADTNSARAAEVAGSYHCTPLGDIGKLPGLADAAIVAIPTPAHAEVGCALMEAGIDVLVEKPIAADLDSADRLIETAHRCGRILQVGHLERWNPAVTALEKVVTQPLFFEIHRLSVFSPRSLDVDVVLDLMIHDLDIVLNLARHPLQEIRAAGISILSAKVDIANVRLEFSGGCVANLTASRVSTERVRKLRLFQPGQYISLDYGKQNAVCFTVNEGRQILFSELSIAKAEPLQVQLDAFLDCVETRAAPKLSGESARRSLEVSLAILAKIEEHLKVVSQALMGGWKP